MIWRGGCATRLGSFAFWAVFQVGARVVWAPSSLDHRKVTLNYGLLNRTADLAVTERDLCFRERKADPRSPALPVGLPSGLERLLRAILLRATRCLA